MSLRDLDLRGFYSASDDRLNGFYVPVLKQAVSYDRMSGYFRSSSLVVAAAGVSHFIANGGSMRLIVGAELAEDDVKAVIEGEPLPDVLARVLLTDPLRGADIVSEHRLETLAYLSRNGRLDFRVGVPTDHLERPLGPKETARYFHSKYGILTDARGDQIAFLGSDNESASGWRDNHETFTVATSWSAEVWAAHGDPIRHRFDDHWDGRPDAGWKVVPLPEAVRERLVALAKPEPPPRRDPEEVAPQATSQLDEALLWFVRAAPRIDGGTGVGFATSGIEPWPHQVAIAERAVDTFPRSYLLADEVGLGKTIEAGLILRELLVSAKIESALLLVPASVLRQWQEELEEKFALSIPRLAAGTFLDVNDNPVPARSDNPWRAFPVVLASSHLARRRGRRDELLAAGPWDVVLVDEAHHARRRGAKVSDEPNTLLALLRAMKSAGACKALYLASATPMQMNAHEAWDLLDLLGLTGAWSESAARFVSFYEELRQPVPLRNWSLLQTMAADFFAEPGVGVDPILDDAVRERLGLAGSSPIRRFHDQGLSAGAIAELTPETQAWLDEWLRRHTPMRERVFRTTRSVLRQYKADGKLPADATVPARSVADRFVPMSAGERALYERIENYIARYYDNYMSGSGERKPLGFIMTIYRRRLTSSFLAIERSLRRRLDVLTGNAGLSDLLDEDDLFSLEQAVYFDVERLEGPARALAEEIRELRGFLDELAQRPPDESKMAYLHDELRDAFRGVHDTAIIFTQYTDTMDYLREQLTPVFGDKVVCYSGRGGQRMNSTTGEWVSLTKDQVKALFRAGDEVKILIGTDSLSEGLNLQTATLLINFDMPWNFMRVEQRIGRIDRIGGKPSVSVSNYFYEDTVEEQIYHGIGEDFNWFEDVVGPAQPVLSQVEQAIERVAMTAPGPARAATLDKLVKEIRVQIQDASDRAVTLADLENSPEEQAVEPAIDLAGLELVLLSIPRVARLFTPHPGVEGAYLVELPSGKAAVTFRRAVLDQHAPAVRLLTYAEPALDELLDVVGAPAHHDRPQEVPAAARSIAEIRAAYPDPSRY